MKAPARLAPSILCLSLTVWPITACSRAGTPPAQSTTPPARAVATTAAPADFSLFVGHWQGHGRVLEVEADGSFTITKRTYRFCQESPPPCDDMSGSEIKSGAVAYGQLTTVNGTVTTGQVASSTAPDLTPLGPITMTLDPQNGAIETTGTIFCGANSPERLC